MILLPFLRSTYLDQWFRGEVCVTMENHDASKDLLSRPMSASEKAHSSEQVGLYFQDEKVKRGTFCLAWHLPTGKLMFSLHRVAESEGRPSLAHGQARRAARPEDGYWKSTLPARVKSQEQESATYVGEVRLLRISQWKKLGRSIRQQNI